MLGRMIATYMLDTHPRPALLALAPPALADARAPALFACHSAPVALVRGILCSAAPVESASPRLRPRAADGCRQLWRRSALVAVARLLALSRFLFSTDRKIREVTRTYKVENQARSQIKNTDPVVVPP
jgi:hypothetical protein